MTHCTYPLNNTPATDWAVFERAGKRRPLGLYSSLTSHQSPIWPVWILLIRGPSPVHRPSTGRARPGLWAARPCRISVSLYGTWTYSKTWSGHWERRSICSSFIATSIHRRFISYFIGLLLRPGRGTSIVMRMSVCLSVYKSRNSMGPTRTPTLGMRYVYTCTHAHP